jgi:GntR family carbon starvation induced transcriptional regulator
MNQTVLARNLIRADIVEGFWRPYALLRMADLKDKYNIGGNPIREALTALVGEGLVKQIVNKGFTVAPLGCDDLRDIGQTQIVIEVAAVRRAMDAGETEWKAEIVSSLFRLTESTRTTATDKASLGQWYDRIQAFHSTVISACGSERLIMLQRRLSDQLRRYLFELISEDIPRDAIIERHEMLAEAVIAGRVEEAVRITEENIREEVDTYLSALVERSSR